MSFAIKPKAKGDEEKMATSLRRLAEEPDADHRGARTGERLPGLSRIRVGSASTA